jgi:hypothetical protein
MEAPRQPAAGVMSRPLHACGPDSDSADRSQATYKLHTAGPNSPDSPDSTIRLIHGPRHEPGRLVATYRRTEQPGQRHPTGPARARSLWLGTRLEQGERCGPIRGGAGSWWWPRLGRDRDGPGSTKMCRCGKVAFFRAIRVLPSPAQGHPSPAHVALWDTAPLRDAPLCGRRCA